MKVDAGIDTPSWDQKISIADIAAHQSVRANLIHIKMKLTAYMVRRLRNYGIVRNAVMRGVRL